MKKSTSLQRSLILFSMSVSFSYLNSRIQYAGFANNTNNLIKYLFLLGPCSFHQSESQLSNKRGGRPKKPGAFV